jgi:magnesium-transporting ATPase (P-type)
MRTREEIRETLRRKEKQEKRRNIIVTIIAIVSFLLAFAGWLTWEPVSNYLRQLDIIYPVLYGMLVLIVTIIAIKYSTDN